MNYQLLCPGQSSRKCLFIGILLSIVPLKSVGFYVPGVAPKEFKLNELIEVKAIKLTSVKTVVPYEYYALPFCKPEGGELHYKSENLGEVMRGDRIVNTPYEKGHPSGPDVVITLFQSITPQHFLCNLLQHENSTCGKSLIGLEKQLIIFWLRFDFLNEISSLHSNRYKDYLLDEPISENDELPVTIGKTESELLRQRIAEDYHVHLLVDNLPCATRYVIPETQEVFFDHGYKLGWTDDSGKTFLNNHLDINLKFHEPTRFEVHPKSIDKSKYSIKQGERSCSIEHSDSPQQLVEGANEIMWTYSVRWEESEIPWASRWDIYLNMKDVQIHWFSILNSLVVVICLTGFLSVIIIRTVRRDIAKYNRDEESDIEDTLEETGWKLVHGDVFRPPRYGMLLVNLVGTGIQLLGMVAVTVSFACLGMLSPSSRGSLTSAGIFLYCLMGLIAGYHSGRLYKTIRGNQPKRAAFRTAFLFPALVLGTGFFLNFFLIGKHSSGAIPFTTMIALLSLWFGVDLPLVFLGFHFGFRKQIYNHPVRTNQIPRQVPEQPWYLKTFPCMLLAGILPFGAVFIEMYFIFSAIWENQFYYLFGFLFVVLSILYISCSQIAIVVTYFLLCAELNIIGFVPTLLYFAYSFLIALTFWILTGTIGFYAAYFFLRKIYASVKID